MSARGRTHKRFKKREVEPKRGKGFTPVDFAISRMVGGGNAARGRLSGKAYKRACSELITRQQR